ncbi:MAG: apolipoprotein N-acyltransferase, partial [Gammaproteobacteria bacterium]|nr:apolipoprotein N-acyltransferase [Gammaproteobacteria bacterium]
AMLFLLVVSGGRRERLLRGYGFGAGAFSTGTYWLYNSIHDVGGVAPPLAVGLCLVLILMMAAYPAAWGLVTALLPRVRRGWQFLAVMPGAWVLLEWVRGWLFTGFPWLSIGYSQTDGPLAAWAPLAGVHGLSLVVVLLAGALAALLGGDRPVRLAALAVLAVIGAGTAGLQGRQWTEASGDPLKVALVQGGITQDRKWLPEELEFTKTLFRTLTVDLPEADLIIWPEAAIPALAHEETDYLQGIDALARARSQTVILGILTFDPASSEFRNSLLTLGDNDRIYHKRHLVPFGEFFPVPDFARNVLRLMNLPYTDITPGSRDQLPLLAGGVALAPSICYEDVFGTETRDFLPAAGLLINVSNDGWFGDSSAPHQHLQMARFRALESGRYMLRSTNTGITAVIDPRGRVTGRGPQFLAVVVEAEVRPHEGATPWVRYGNAPVLGLALLLCLLPLAWTATRRD